MPRPLTPDQVVERLDCLPVDCPFTYRTATDLGVDRRILHRMVEHGRLRRPVQGVYHRAVLPDTIELRLACIALVVPPDCVVTDRTAAWVWCGDRVLAPGAHLATPRIDVFAPPGRRLRNGLMASGERRLAPYDVRVVGGVRVTSPLRTACDLGRLLHADSALAAMDALCSHGRLDPAQLEDELRRFRGFRGILQARQWAPWVDPGSESWLESIGRKRWIEAGLPRPRCQCPVPAPDGGELRIDVGLEEERFGLEVYGAEFHGEDREDHDEARVVWLTEQHCWNITIARSQHITGPQRDLDRTLRATWARHRR